MNAVPESPSRRPWWKRIDTWGALALWLILLAYPFSVGPAYYASNRGLIPYGSHLSFYQPLWEVAVANGAERPLKRYVTSWTWLAQRHHDVSDLPVINTTDFRQDL